MNRIWRSFIRTTAFIGKEIFEILRQPRLLFTLVLGPFLILLIFGIGYRADAPPLRTLFVVHEGSPLEEQIEEYATSLGPQLVYMGVIHDGDRALEELQQDEVDLVAVAPADAYEKIRNNEPATFTLYHLEIDPFQVDYIHFFGQIYVDEVNRRVLQQITVEGQREASDLREDISSARTSLSALNTALRANDQFAARQHRRDVDQNLDNISLAVGASIGLLSSVQQTLGGEEAPTSDALTTLNQLREDTEGLEEETDEGRRTDRLERIETGLAELEENLGEFERISPEIIVSPFRSEIRGLAPFQPETPDFFAPAVVALLLQHMAVTFASLSIVRERTVGTMELFRVSPLSSAEALLGKYISYMLLGALITTALTLLLIYGLGLPMLGLWLNYVLVVTAILFTSLGIGFLISILSQTDSQAVQYTMIVLLASVFFSGFMLSLNMLWEPVRVVSWMLPTTYGIILLRDIILRGLAPDLTLLIGLVGIGIGLLIISWLLLRRLISRSHK
jgi:ABC-2 type transport system permease protein